jgi:hypothetical protein
METAVAIEVLSRHLPVETEENKDNISVRTSSFPAEIRTKHLLNTTVEH